MLIPKGSRLIMNLHYTVSGKPGTDRARGALEILPNKPKNLVHMWDRGGPGQDNIIPAGNPNFPGEASAVFTRDVKLSWLQPHFHVRGKDWKYTLTYPDGRKEVLLDVPKYEFLWQTIYYPDKPITFPAGTRLDVIGHWDNSAANKMNPDPTVPAIMGQQNWEEMYNIQVYVIIPSDMKLEEAVAEVVPPGRGRRAVNGTPQGTATQ